jgi:hypothetical protein
VLPVGLREGFVMYFCYQSAVWRGFILYHSRPVHKGFVSHFLSVNPSIEALYCIFYQSVRPLRLVRHFMPVGLDFCCFQSLHESAYIPSR